MTTYNGRSASYVPGKEVVNKEPPVSKYVVEKLYRVHRERLQKAEPTIDSHVQIPDFLTNQSWKKNAERQRLIDIQRENQEMFGRISKVENEESTITKENKAHIKRVENKLSYLRKLKRHGRLVQMVKIQRENEYFLKRLEKAKPQYTLKKCKEWYKYHEHYKNGRRTDPTAGHIMNGMKGLLPPNLPPLSPSLMSSLCATDPLEDYLKDRPTAKRKTLPAMDNASVSQQSLASQSMLSSTAESRFRSSTSPSRVSVGGGGGARYSQSAGSLSESRQEDEEYEEEEYYEEDDECSALPPRSHATERERDGREDADDLQSIASRDPSLHEVANEDLFLLSARPFALPFESKSCMVQVFSSREYDENLRLRVVNSGITHDVLAERLVPIDKAYEVVNANGHTNQIVHSTDSEDLQSLSALLINMFKEADEDNSGSLTFDEFQSLMEQVELGISSQELRFVISEADENENGVVDYEEFVPLAVDLIQSFRARNRAKALNSHEDVMVDDVIYKAISTEDLQTAANLCLEKIYEVDPKRYGLIRAPELKKALNAIAANVGVRENEISLLCQMLPRDQFGRVKYNSTPSAFLEALSKVRFMTMKNAMIEAQGSGLQKYLLDLCKDEEMKSEHFKGPRDKFVPNGVISCRSLISILSGSSRLSLSRLQVLVIMSEASVLDGMINYFQFVPVVAKAIEIMFEPKALRQRAELIEKTDLSPEALLQGMSSDMFEQRLLTLFKSYDIDHNGMLDQNEFVACLESLELQLTYGEMVALMAAADSEQHGYLRFEEFVGFFTHNLLNLEREKRLRLLQSSMQKDASGGSGSGASSASGAGGEGQEQDLITRLTQLFELYDPSRSGFIRFEDFDAILHNFSLHSSRFLMDLMISELQVNEDGLVEYNKSLRLCGDLLKVFKAKENALEEHKQREAEAEAKALHLAQVSVEETNRTVKYLKQRLREINETSGDALTKSLEAQNAVRAPFSGLSKSEANMIISKLFMSAAARPGSATAAQAASPKADRERERERDKTTRSAKAFRFNYSSQELFDAVLEARKTTIMRSLLRDNLDASSAKQWILSALQRELEACRKRGEVSVESSFLPLQQCFDVLDNLRQFRLTRAQSMFIISYADCYDRDGLALEIFRFAEQAASIVGSLSAVESLETRAEVLHHSSIDDRKALHGMLEKDLVALLEFHFDKLCEAQAQAQAQGQGHGGQGAGVAANAAAAAAPRERERDREQRVTAEEVRAVLKELSRLRLSEREIATVLVSLSSAAHPHNEDDNAPPVERAPSLSVDSYDSFNVNDAPGISLSLLPQSYNAREIVPLIVDAIRSLKRETMIHRRVSLAATSMSLQGRGDSFSSQTRKLQEESVRQLKDVAGKLLNFVKLTTHGDRVVIALPSDGAHRRTSQMMAETHVKMHQAEVLTLFRGALFLPKTVHRAVACAAQPVRHSPRASGRKGSLNSASSSSAAAAATATTATAAPTEEVETTHSKVGVFLQLDAMEDLQMFSGCNLFVHVTSVDGAISMFEQLPVKLSSLGVVDHEAAQQYASNLVEKMYFEQAAHDSKLVLKMVDQ